MPDVRLQPVTGVIPPQIAEAMIRMRWPSVARFPAVAGLGRASTRTIILAPVAWLIMGPFYFTKVLPIIGRRYVLTNRRLMIAGGWSGKPVEEVPLDKIDDVLVIPDSNSEFFRAATVKIITEGRTAMTLPGTPDAEAFRMSILSACNAWVPGRTKRQPFVPASA